MRALVRFVTNIGLCACALALPACHHASATSSSTMPSGAAESAKEDDSDITTKEVTYSSGTTELKGFIAYPATRRKRPGVLVVHEWWGLNDYTRSRAKQLAEAGYVALAIDMYGEGKHTTHPEEAKEFMMQALSNLDEAKARFKAAEELLANDPHVDSDKLAAIGYCFGGATVLHMARFGDDKLDVVASFHGNLATQKPMAKGAFGGKILVAAGGADPFVPKEQVSAFKAEMDAAGADYELVEYPGAKHAFTNPEADKLGQETGLPFAYDAEADADSWRRLLALLDAM
jgi:dienelactone hydrolase